MVRRMTEHVARVQVFPDRESVARSAAEIIIKTAAEGTREHPRRILLSGGRTPEAMYRLLATEPIRSRIDWPSIEFYFGDERPVPPDHPDSNFGLARRSLLEPLGLRAPRTFRIRGETSDLELAARRYEALIRDRVAEYPTGVPTFDLVFLGLGVDGHTASIFPGVPIPDDPPRLVVAVWVETLHAHRATVTYRVLNAARQVVFLVTGNEKAEALRQTLSPQPGQPPTPAAKVSPPDGDVLWLADRSAAGRLPKQGPYTLEEVRG